MLKIEDCQTKQRRPRSIATMFFATLKNSKIGRVAPQSRSFERIALGKDAWPICRPTRDTMTNPAAT
jgi:hypothetical protein